MRKTIATLPEELRRSITWERRCPTTSSSPPRQGSLATSAIPMPPGSVDRTRTLTAGSASIFPRAPTSPDIQPRTDRHPMRPQDSTAQNPRLSDTIRDFRTGRCDHRSNPPILKTSAVLSRRSSTATALMVDYIDGHKDEFGSSRSAACCSSPRRPTTPPRSVRCPRERCTTRCSLRSCTSCEPTTFGSAGPVSCGRPPAVPGTRSDAVRWPV